MLKDTGHFTTPNASKYLEQLCKHFAHKVNVTHEGANGTVALGTGPTTLKAADTVLTIEVTAANAAALEEARDIIDRHLARFAHREGFENMLWTEASGAALTD